MLFAGFVPRRDLYEYFFEFGLGDEWRVGFKKWFLNGFLQVVGQFVFAGLQQQFQLVQLTCQFGFAGLAFFKLVPKRVQFALRLSVQFVE